MVCWALCQLRHVEGADCVVWRFPLWRSVLIEIVTLFCSVVFHIWYMLSWIMWIKGNYNVNYYILTEDLIRSKHFNGRKQHKVLPIKKEKESEHLKMKPFYKSHQKPINTIKQHWPRLDTKSNLIPFLSEKKLLSTKATKHSFTPNNWHLLTLTTNNYSVVFCSSTLCVTLLNSGKQSNCSLGVTFYC